MFLLTLIACSSPGRAVTRRSCVATIEFRSPFVSERKLRELLPELPHIRRGGVVLIPAAHLRKRLGRAPSTARA